MHIRINADIMRLLGYFLSDGSMYHNNFPTYQIGFYFSKEEDEFANDVEKIIYNEFKIKSTSRELKRNCILLRYSSKKLYDIFVGLMGYKCNVHNKKIPSWALWSPPLLQMDLIKGFFRGDGTKQGRSISLSTVSRNLAKGLQLLLLRNGIFSRLHKLIYQRKKEGERFRGCGWIYFINYTENRKKANGGIVDKDKLVCRIKKLEKEKCSLPIYGLKVEKDESYYAELLMHHNSSHCLEDIDDPKVAIQNWWRILKTGGYLILSVPHRDLFERKRSLPSHGNKNHKHFFLIDRYEYPCTIGMVPFITKNLSSQDIIYVKKCDDGYSCNIVQQEAFPLGVHVIASGELSIEAVIRKSEKVMYVEDFLSLKSKKL
jgi:SAM-dependent methyltransferase